jgi:hypothetical protein
MNKIEKELFLAIDAAEGYNDDGLFLNKYDAADNTFLVSEKHCVNFLIWQQENKYSREGKSNTWFKGIGNKIADSTKELFKLYIKSL